jgi:uncharacterized protein (TIRG00374 family)
MQRIALRARSWSDVVAPQLAGNAASNVLPVGSALGSIVQLRMLHRRGFDLTRAITALTITGMLTNVAGMLVFPLALLLPIGDLGEVDVDAMGRVGLAALAVAVPLVVLALRSQRPMNWVAKTCHRALSRVPWCHPPPDLASRIVRERDLVRDALGGRVGLVAFTSVGRAVSDYLTLYASMLAVGLRPSPALVLAAFIAANAAGMVPLTPGGLGFVEAGLSGALLLAGAPEVQAVAAVAIYRMVSCWLPALAGLHAYVWSRRSASVPEVTATRASPAIENTCLGVPAAAQTVA